MKRISPATVTICVLAVLFGLVSAFVVRRYLEPVEAGPPMATIVVPRINLPTYARIRDQDIEVKQIPVAQLPPDAMTSPSQALFRMVRTTIMAGQPITNAALYDVDEVPTLSEQLPPGQRAVTINVNRANALDGVLLPESLVDVTLTVQGDHPELAGVATLTLLRGVRVLATNQDRFRTEERLNQSLTSITVAATPEQANKLILAQRYGMLSVTLRSELDDQFAANDDGRNLVNPHDLLGLPPRNSLVNKAQIWRGGQMTVVEFSDSEIRESRDTTAAVEAREADDRLAPAVSQPEADQVSFLPLD